MTILTRTQMEELLHNLLNEDVTMTGMTSPTPQTTAEPAGAERFRAVSYPSGQTAQSAAATVQESPPVEGAVEASIAALEARLAELEAVVHAVAPFSRNAEHPGVVAWLEKMGSIIKKGMRKGL